MSSDKKSFGQWLASLFKQRETTPPCITRREIGENLILFVHGLTGSPADTWGHMISALNEDSDMSNISFDCFGYPTDVLRTGLGSRMSNIQQLASGLRTHIEVEHKDKRAIVIVGHSLGGLVARQYLLEEVKAGRPMKTRGVAFFATPHTGAELARVGKYLSIGQRHLSQLSPGGDLLKSINQDWVSLKVEAALDAIFIVGGGDKVVSEESASPYYETKNVHTLIGHGHREIIKPIGQDDTRYKILKQFATQTLDPPSPHSTSAEAGDPLFDLYTRESENFYVKRKNDAVLFTATKAANAWVSGPTGTGKTAALRRLVDLSNWKLQHVSLGACQSQETLHLLKSLCAQLFERANIEPPPLSSLDLESTIAQFRRVLERLCGTEPIAVLVEEIPLPTSESMGQFIQLVEQLILAIDAALPKGSIIWLFSSINSPRQHIDPECIKFREKVQLLDFAYWSRDEIRALLAIIDESGGVPLTDEEKEVITNASHGSPRFVKMVIREKRNEVGATKSIQDLVHSVTMDFPHHA